MQIGVYRNKTSLVCLVGLPVCVLGDGDMKALAESRKSSNSDVVEEVKFKKASIAMLRCCGVGAGVLSHDGG